MSVARTCARKRRQMKLDRRYGVRETTVSRKLQGRAKLLAQCALTRKNTNTT